MKTREKKEKKRVLAVRGRVKAWEKSRKNEGKKEDVENRGSGISSSNAKTLRRAHF